MAHTTPAQARLDSCSSDAALKHMLDRRNLAQIAALILASRPEVSVVHVENVDAGVDGVRRCLAGGAR